MKRVMIFGCPGAGKSTAARHLASITGLPLIHLDWHHWQPGWQRMQPEAWGETVTQLAAQEAWIIDGQYSGTLQARTARTDTALYLDFPTCFCLYRVLKRAILGHGKPRDTEFKPGLREKLDIHLLHYTLNFKRLQRSRDIAALKNFSGQTHLFKSPHQLKNFFLVLERQQNN